MYRPNVCAFIFNEKGEFLACKRIKEDEYQCVQGGIEHSDRDVVLAALREIEEEIGLTAKDVTFVQELQPPNNDRMQFSYILRPHANLRRYGFVGQQQRILLFYAPMLNIHKVRLVPPPGMNAQQEFSRVRWLPMSELLKRCPAEKANVFQAAAPLAVAAAEKFLQNDGVTVHAKM